MYSSIYQYLILHQKASLPGIGTISMQRHPAQYNVAEKAFYPPSYTFELKTGDDHPSKQFFEWISQREQITEWEAIKQLNDFCSELRNQLSGGKEVSWEQVGVLKKNLKGHIVLDSATVIPGDEKAVVVEKVIRENAQHTMRVGERERTSSEMEVILTEPSKRKRKAGVIMLRDVVPRRRKHAWLIALVLGLVSLIFIFVYFSQKGLKPSSTGSQVKVKIK